MKDITVNKLSLVAGGGGGLTLTAALSFQLPASQAGQSGRHGV